VIRFVIRLAAFAITAVQGISSRAAAAEEEEEEEEEGDVDHGNGTLPLRFAKSILSHAARTEPGQKCSTKGVSRGESRASSEDLA